MPQLHLSPALHRRVTLGLMAVAALAVPWLAPPVYDTSPPTPFHGPWLNPYQNVRGPFAPVAIHAHGEAWAGLTAGAQPVQQVSRAYRDAGYAAVVITDYMKLTPEGTAVLSYEHGYNRAKTHQVVLGAQSVVWFDQPAFSTFDGKQWTLRKLSSSAELVALAHPLLSGGYSREELSLLDGYHAIEVASHARPWTEAWDIALSSGRRVWGIAGDDSHDIEDPRESFRAWTMVPAADGDLLETLKAGRQYSMWSGMSGAPVHNALEALTVDGSVATVRLQQSAHQILVFGQGGALLAGACGGDRFDQWLLPSGSYVRFEITTGPQLMLLNPIVREHGVAPNTVSWWRSWLRWLLAPALIFAWVIKKPAGAVLR